MRGPAHIAHNDHARVKIVTEPSWRCHPLAMRHAYRVCRIKGTVQ